MATLTLSESQARKIYPSAQAELKTILEDTFGKPFFSQKITDRIRTFEDACFEIGENANAECYIQGAPDEIAYRKLKAIIKVLNEDWVPNWDNGSERKWFPWFYLNGPSGFRLDYVSYRYTASTVGSRLCFKSEELTQHAVRYFLNYYKDFYTL